MNNNDLCINCGQQLIQRAGILICLRCNSDVLSVSEIFIEPPENDDYTFIECPGATLFKESSNEVEAGVRFVDDDDPLKGYEIIDHPVYAPNHKKKRRIKAEAYGKIRRCQACQDLTIRMRRREGPDFFVPSSKHPGRKKLKPVRYRTYA